MSILSKYNSLTLLFLITLSVAGTGTMGSESFPYPDPDISIGNLKDTVRYLTALTPARSYIHIESMNKSAAYILNKFSEYGLRTTEQVFTAKGKSYVNVIASVGPQGGRRVIVGAHYDVCGDQPGADDNASGIAGLLEIARFAKKHEAELPYRTDFVAYALEEPPFFRTRNMGSYMHAKSLHDGNVKVKVKGMVCLEMIGYFTNAEKSQSYPLPFMGLFYPNKGNFIGVVGNFGSSSLIKQVATHMKATSVDVETLRAPSFVIGVDFSDHRNYWKFGYDAVMVTDTAFYRNPNYHKETDTIDTLSFHKMKEVVKGVCWSLLNMK